MSAAQVHHSSDRSSPRLCPFNSKHPVGKARTNEVHVNDAGTLVPLLLQAQENDALPSVWSGRKKWMQRKKIIATIIGHGRNRSNRGQEIGKSRRKHRTSYPPPLPRHELASTRSTTKPFRPRECETVPRGEPERYSSRTGQKPIVDRLPGSVAKGFSLLPQPHTRHYSRGSQTGYGQSPEISSYLIYFPIYQVI